ncbi:MAG: hypothetical protein HC810_02830 [Acaryochloridaceae cyanobacterium RL_2_7]|nr:hypothetical protein [Acaryochloridaceae cyanobacterium RL_2_7]
MTQSIARPDSDQSLDSLRKVIYELQASTNIEALSEVVSHYIQSHLGYELVWMGLYDSGSETIEGPWRVCSEAKNQSKSISVLPGDLFDQVLLTRRTSTVPSLQEESRVGDWQTLSKKLNIQGAIIQTIRYQKESMGVLLIGTTKWGVNSRQEESDQFTILANTIGATLKLLKSQSVDISSCLNLPESGDPALLDLLSVLSQCVNWDEQLTTLVHELIAAHPEYSLGLYLLDADQGDFESYRLHKASDQRSYRSRHLTHGFPYHQNSSFFRLLERQKNLVISDVQWQCWSLSSSFISLLF